MNGFKKNGKIESYGCKKIKNFKNITFRYIIVLLIFSTIIIPSLAVSTQETQSGILDNSKYSDCLTCHNKDVGVHANMNSGAPASGLNPENKACWGCHQDKGSPPMAHTDIRNKSEAYQCADCHGPDKPYPGVNNAPTIELYNTSSEGMTANTEVTTAGYVTQAVTSSRSGEGHTKCLDCHGNSPIQFIQPDGSYGPKETAATCVDCHQTGTVGAGNPLFITAYVLGEPLHHSNDPNNGSIWKRAGESSFWTSQLTGCIYCHGDVQHSPTPIGNPLRFKDTNTVRQFGTWCSSCHYKGYSLYGTMLGIMSQIPPEITKDATYGNYSDLKYYDHSGIGNFQDIVCNNCHGNRANASSLMHNIAIGGGGPNCIACHDITTNGAPKHVDVSAMGQADSIHKDLNKDATTTLNQNNKKCWSCHGNGSEPSGHPDNYKRPATCVDCHAGSNVNFTPSNTILRVSEHYWNGDQIKTLGVSSCYQCHNKSEMMVPANDPDLGTINGGLNTGNNSTSHYGKKRTDIHSANETNCAYCHQNTSEFNNVFIKSSNTQITHNNGRSCYLCHREVGSTDGRIHDSSLIGGSGGEDCISCHVPGDVNTTKFARHANVNTSDGENNVTNNDCWTCHYQKDMNRSHVYMCDSCHKNRNGVVDVTDPALLVGNLQHGTNTCKSCHAPDTYHVQGTAGPRGRVEKPGWSIISPYIYAGCHDCHRTHNGLDEPFHGPGIDPRIIDLTGAIITGIYHAATNINSSSSSSECSFSCHFTTVHNVREFRDNLKPELDNVSLSPSTVIIGSSVYVTASGSSISTSTSLQIEAAQYQIRNFSNIVIQDWTAMNAEDGKFDSLIEKINATINTSGMPEGTYNVSVRVMASAPRTNISQPYYPLNGDWSLTTNAILTITETKGFINGTVRNVAGDVIPDVKVRTETGEFAVTDGTGSYSLSLVNGTYTLTATKDPEYYVNNTIPPAQVLAPDTVIRDIILRKKATGTITGQVTKISSPD